MYNLAVYVIRYAQKGADGHASMEFRKLYLYFYHIAVCGFVWGFVCSCSRGVRVQDAFVSKVKFGFTFCTQLRSNGEYKNAESGDRSAPRVTTFDLRGA